MVDKSKSNENGIITEAEFMEFLSSMGEKRWKILLHHAEKNNTTIKIRRKEKMEQHNVLIANQFNEFCHTKGITAKFKVAFTNMAENAHNEHEMNKKEFEEVKRQSAKDNEEFVEFLQTKGIKARFRLVIENIKKSAKESTMKVAYQNDMITSQTKENIARSKNSPSYDDIKSTDISNYSLEEITKEFNLYLKSKGLDTKYSVDISEAEEE